MLTFLLLVDAILKANLRGKNISYFPGLVSKHYFHSYENQFLPASFLSYINEGNGPVILNPKVTLESHV